MADPTAREQIVTLRNQFSDAVGYEQLKLVDLEGQVAQIESNIAQLSAIVTQFDAILAATEEL